MFPIQSKTTQLQFNSERTPPYTGFSTESCFLWLHDKNIAFNQNIRGMVNYEYNRLLLANDLASYLISGGEDLEQLGMDKSTPIICPDFYLYSCYKIMSPYTEDPFNGLNLSTATFFQLLHDQNVKYGANVRGLVNQRYNELLAEAGVSNGKIPGSNLEELSKNTTMLLNPGLYAKAYRYVISQFEPKFNSAHAYHPFYGLQLSTATFFHLLHDQNVKHSANIRGLINQKYNELLGKVDTSNEKIPGNDLEELGKNTSTLLNLGLYAKAYRHVTFESSFNSSRAEVINTILNNALEEIQFNEKRKIENVKAQAKTNPLSVMKDIKSFGICSQEALFEIAKICSESDRFPEYVSFFGIQEESKRLELVEISAQKHPKRTADYMRRFQIVDQKQRTKIAEKLAERVPAYVTCSIQSFEIIDEIDRIKIAELCAKNVRENDPSIEGMISNLIWFKINKDALINIVKMLAKKNVPGAISGIRFLGIDDPNELEKLALCFAQINGYETAQDIEKFKIRDRSKLKEIAFECAFESGIRAARVLQLLLNFNPLAKEYCLLFWKKDKDDVKIKILKQWASELFDNSYLSMFCDEIAALSNDRIKSEKISCLSECLFLFECGFSKEQLQWIDKEQIVKTIIDFPLPHMRLSLCRALTRSVQIDRFSAVEAALAINKTERSWMKLVRILLAGLCCHGMNQKTAIKFISATIGRTNSIFYKGENQKVLIEMLIWLIKEQSLTVIEKGNVLFRIIEDAELELAKQAHTRNPHSDQLIVANEAKKKLELALHLEKFLEQESNLDIKLQLKTVEQFFVDVKLNALSGKMKNLFERSLQEFSNVETASELKTKIREFLRLFASKKNKNSWHRSIEMIDKQHDPVEFETQIQRNISAVVSSLQVDPLLLKSIGKNLRQTVEKSLSQKLCSSDVDDLSSKLLQNFDSNIADLMTYFAKLSTLEDKNVMQALREYVTAVLNGTFEAKRNAITNNLHLKTICEAQPTLLKKWFEPLEPVLTTITQGGKTLKLTCCESTDPIKIFRIGKCGDTCQRVTEAPSTSRGLLGYLMDGKNRFILLLDEDQNVVGRCLLRLMWNGQKAVIFKEENYFSVADDEKVAGLLYKIAKNKAEVLNTDLVSYSCEKQIPYGKPLMALGSAVPYEYCDALRGMQEWGNFTIRAGLLSYSPNAIEEQESENVP